jgi:hypothetical protein
MDRPSRDPKRPGTGRLQPSIAGQVSGRLVIAEVRHAIHLDREPEARAIKVEHKRPDGVLSAESQSVQLTAPERDPQSRFGGRERLAKVTRIANGLAWYVGGHR